MRVDTVPTDYRKPHLFEDHSDGPQLPGRPDQSVHGYTDVDWAGNAGIAGQPLRSHSCLGAPRSCGAARSSRQLHYRARS